MQIVSTDADEHVEREFISHPSCSAAPHEHAERAEIRALLERRLDELPEAFRVVFTLRSVQSCTSCVGWCARCTARARSMSSKSGVS